MEGDRSKKESSKSRKILISNLPDTISIEDMKKELFYSQNFKVSYVKLEENSAQVALANVSEAKRAAKLINGQLYKGKRISVTLAPILTTPPSTSPRAGVLLVVGNLPFEYTEDEFRDLMCKRGEIRKSFLVRNTNTGQSKGYGFVEFVKKDSAIRAKEYFTTTNAKFVSGRIIRVDIASPNVAVGKEKHSRTLFVDHLPKSFDDDEYLKDLFSKTGAVTFCRIALKPGTGLPRGFAFLDYKTVEEAEQSQEYHDGTQIGDENIRVTFCTPGKTARDIFGKFDDQKNNWDPPSGPRGRGNLPFHAIGPGMVGPRGPRMPIVVLGNPRSMLAMERYPSPGMAPMPRGVIRGPRPFGPGGPAGIPGVPIGPGGHRIPRLLGPEGIRPRPRFVVRPSLEAQGPRLRVPYARPPNVRTLHPKLQADNANKKHSIKTTYSSYTKPKPKASTSIVSKVGEPAKTKDATTKEKKTTEEESSTVSLSELQKLGASALAAAMDQSPSDSNKVKVLQPVVFMDAEQFQQFQQFQELMQKQKESEETDGSAAVSLEDLAKTQQEKESQKVKKESDSPSPKPQAPVSLKLTLKRKAPQKETTPTPPQPTPSPTQRKEKQLPKEPSPRHPAPRPQSNESLPPHSNQRQQQQQSKESLPPHSNQRQQQQQQSKESLPPHSNQRQQEQQQQQPRQQQQTQGQRLIKTLGEFERERKVNGFKDPYGSKQASTKTATASTSVPPLQPPPKLPIEPHILKQLFQATNKRQFEEQVTPTAVKEEYEEDRRTLSNANSRITKTAVGQGVSRSSYSSPYESTGQPIMAVREAPRVTPKTSQTLQSSYAQKYQSPDEKDQINVPKRSPANETTPREQGYNRSRYAYTDTTQRERSSGDSGLGQTPSPRYEREKKESEEPEKYSRTRSELQTGRERDNPPPREARSAYDTLPARDAGPSREIRSLRDAVVARDLRSLRDILPPRDSMPTRDAVSSRDTLSHRDTLPQRDTLTPRERLPRDMAQRDSFSAQRQRDPLSSHDVVPPRVARASHGLAPSLYDREMVAALRDRDGDSLRRERDPLPLRYKATDLSPRLSREAADRARYERVVSERFGREKEFPRYERESIEARYARSLPSRDSALGSTRGLPSHYPTEGPLSKRPRY